MMNRLTLLLSKLKLCFKLNDLYLAWFAIKEIVNWPLYFLDFFSLVPRKFVIFRMRDSLCFKVRANTWDRGAITRIHLADEYHIKEARLSRDATVIDIGAHIGTFSVFISKRAKQVFAYEPILENFSLLKQNIELNNLNNSIFAFNCAVSDKNEALNIYLSDFNTAGHSAFAQSNNYISVPAVSLQTIFDRHKISFCDFLKIDAEGAEYKILYNLPTGYFDRIKRIHLEYHDFYFSDSSCNVTALQDFLSKFGFAVSIKGHILIAHK